MHSDWWAIHHIYIEDLHFILKIKIHIGPCLNPHCSSPIAHSVLALTLLISTLPNNLPTTLNKLIPLELLHSHSSPFPFYRGTIHAPRQSKGTTPKSKFTFNSLTSHSNTSIPPFFKSSNPGALPDLISFTASLISTSDIALPFKSFKPQYLPIANYIDICLPDICRIQYLLKILVPSPQINTIT